MPLGRDKVDCDVNNWCSFMLTSKRNMVFGDHLEDYLFQIVDMCEYCTGVSVSDFRDLLTFDEHFTEMLNMFELLKDELLVGKHLFTVVNADKSLIYRKLGQTMDLLILFYNDICEETNGFRQSPYRDIYLPFEIYQDVFEFIKMLYKVEISLTDDGRDRGYETLIKQISNFEMEQQNRYWMYLSKLQGLVSKNKEKTSLPMEDGYYENVKFCHDLYHEIGNIIFPSFFTKDGLRKMRTHIGKISDQEIKKANQEKYIELLKKHSSIEKSILGTLMSCFDIIMSFDQDDFKIRDYWTKSTQLIKELKDALVTVDGVLERFPRIRIFQKFGKEILP